MSTRTAFKCGAAIALAALFIASAPAEAQDLHPSRRPSPVGLASTFIDGTYVKVTYGRPYMRGRQIFGSNSDSAQFLVPYGELWRTGANEATEITVTGPVLVEGERLEAGTYSIFTVPGPTEWVIHVSPHLGLDGPGRFNAATNEFTMVYDEADDVLQVTVPSRPTDEPVDQFTISFEPSGSGANMLLQWEETEVPISIKPVQ